MWRKMDDVVQRLCWKKKKNSSSSDSSKPMKHMQYIPVDATKDYSPYKDL